MVGQICQWNLLVPGTSVARTRSFRKNPSFYLSSCGARPFVRKRFGPITRVKWDSPNEVPFHDWAKNSGNSGLALDHTTLDTAQAHLTEWREQECRTSSSGQGTFCAFTLIQILLSRSQKKILLSNDLSESVFSES